jgi:hypothetical protein
MIVFCFHMQGKIFLSVLMASVMCLQFSMQEEDVLEHTIGKRHSCTL